MSSCSSAPAADAAGDVARTWSLILARVEGWGSDALPLAAYLGVVEFELGTRLVGRLADRDHALIGRWAARVEEDRENGSFDQLVDDVAGDIRRALRGEPQLRRVV